MKKEFFDFDKLFEQFVRDKFKNVKNVDPELVRASLGALYKEWSEAPQDSLGGESPFCYFKDIDSPELLIEFLKNSCEGERRPNSFLLDRICELDSTAPLLRALISHNFNSTLTLTAIELLQIMGASEPLSEYIEMLREDIQDVELKEVIIESLIQNANSVKEDLFLIAEDASIELKTIFAEILICADRDERTLELLRQLFVESDNTPLICSYIGKYGDERLASVLYKAIESCNYLEYIEIKNAIERMGGMVDDYRDFSDDAYYKIIKGEGGSL